jgi:hypothetical protein
MKYLRNLLAYVYLSEFLLLYLLSDICDFFFFFLEGGGDIA